MKRFVLLILVCIGICLLAKSSAEFISIEEYMENSANLEAFDEEIVNELSSSYYVIDGVLFQDHVLMRYPALKTADLYSIPEGTVSIDLNAFAHVKIGTISKIYLPSSCIDLGYPIGPEWWLEYLGGVTDINVDSQNPCFSSENGLLLSKDRDTLLFYPRGRNDKVFEIPEGVRYIANGACMACDFEKVVFSESVLQIGDYAFYQNQLDSIVFNDQLSYIGVGAFEASASLESITIPKGVDKIDYNAFAACSTLHHVQIDEGVREIEDYAFWGSPISNMHLPASLTQIGDIIACDKEDENDCLPCTYYVPQNSYALKWVIENGFTYMIDEK